MTDILILKLQLEAAKAAVPANLEKLDELYKMFDMGCVTDNQTLIKISKEAILKLTEDGLLNRQRSFEILKQIPQNEWPKD